MPKFEYATLVFESAKFLGNSKLDHEAFHKRLNDYGSEGWELVNVFPLARGYGDTREVTAIFKRPCSES